MKELEQMKSLIDEAMAEGDKFYNKSNSAAGTRLRKHMMEIKNLAGEVRKDVTTKKDERKG